MFRIMKRYCPHAGGHTSDFVLGIIGASFLLLSIVFGWFVVRDENLSGLFLSLCIGAWFCPFTILVFVKLPEGYLLEQDRIVYHCKCKKNQLLYKDIKCIIVTNFVVSSRITKTPWAAVIGKEENEIISYVMSDKKRHVLTSDDMKYKLGEKIGVWHPGNIGKILKKGSCTTYDYGFVWNKKEMYKILEGFGGDYYIAASVIYNYKEDFHEICEKYGIDNQRIYIIDDTVNGEFVWRY